MSSEKNKSTILRWFDAINEKNLTICDKIAEETYAPDFVLHDPRFPNSANPESGPAGAKNFVRHLLSDSPDVLLTIEDMIAEGDKVVFRFTVHRTDTNTRKPVTLLIISIVRFVNGQFAEEWELGVPGEW